MAAFTQKNREIGISKSPFGEDDLLAWKLVGHEELGRPFRYELTMLSEKTDLVFADVIGQDLTFRLNMSAVEARFFNGIVMAFQQEAQIGALTAYRATLEPWTSLMTHRKNCRIFQEKSVPDIIKEIFGEMLVTPNYEAALSGSYAPREYCIQFNETDFDFVSRLMEEEGIYYYFKHDAEKHMMVICDSASAHAPLFNKQEADTVGLRNSHNLIESWVIREEYGANVYRVRDLDYLKPQAPIEELGSVNDGRPNWEVYEYPGGALDPQLAKARAATRAEELAAVCVTAAGATTVARGIQPGFLFTLEDHARADQNREYLAWKAEFAIEGEAYEGGAASSALRRPVGRGLSPMGGAADASGLKFRCEFAAIPSDRRFRPARLTPRPRVSGPQSATVTGPSGEEIHTDENGRIKVQFNWDILGGGDDKSSCWIRVAQMWAGNGFGALFLPRVGHEVLVAFLDGDLDRPVAIGSVHNTVNPVPYELPANATVSVLRTSTSPGGGTANEIRFEDKSGKQQLAFTASKDHVVTVANDSVEKVGNDLNVTVEHDCLDTVKNDRHVMTTKKHSEQIGEKRSLTIKGDEDKEVGGKLKLVVKDKVSEEFKADHEEKTTGKYSLKAKEVTIEADSKIELKVGGSKITIEAAKITIKSTEVGVEAQAKAEVKGAQLSLNGSAMAELKGGLVKIN
jgi:type VI secretion system secreted protein VgrG